MRKRIDDIVLAELDCGLTRSRDSVALALAHSALSAHEITLALWRLLARGLIRVTGAARIQLTDLGRERA